MKKTYSVYVDDNKVTRARALGFELSPILERSLDMVLSQEFEDLVINSKLAIFNERISEIKIAIAECQYRLKAYQSDLETLELEKQALLKDYEYTKRVIHINNLTQALNQIIIMQGYDLEATRNLADDIIQDLTKVNPSFNLEMHAERLKLIMES